MTEIQGSAALDVAQVVAGLRKMKAEIDANTRSMAQLGQQGDRTKRALRDTFKDAGQAAGKAGGPVGSWTSKLFSGASMGDAWSRVAVGLSLVTVGMRTYQSAVDAAIDRTRTLIQAQNEVRNAADQADKAIEGQARRGESQMAGRLKVVAAGGQEAADAVDAVTGSGLVSQGQANSGVAAIYGRFGKTDRARAAVHFANVGAAAGLDFNDVATELTRHGAALDDSSQMERLIGRMIQRSTGARGNPEDLYREAAKNIYEDPYLRKWQRDNATRSGIAAIERDRFLTTGLANRDLAREKAPAAFFEGEAFKKFTQSIEDLKKLAESQGLAARILADVFQPGGSFETQIRRWETAYAAALGLLPAAPSFNPNQAFPTGPYIPQAFGR